jgi:hypothetical protein
VILSGLHVQFCKHASRGGLCWLQRNCFFR